MHCVRITFYSDDVEWERDEIERFASHDEQLMGRVWRQGACPTETVVIAKRSVGAMIVGGELHAQYCRRSQGHTGFLMGS